jgi:GT2 family glycosyltransferase
MHRTSGNLILYLDGDMELITGWLDPAARFIMEHPELAGVTGFRRDIQADAEQSSSEDTQHYDQGGRPVQVRFFGGCALYRRAALEQVGGFNPFLISNEEPELCMRLRYAGYKLMRIPYLMCKNYTVPLNSWEYIVRRFRTNLWLGYGQVLRYHLKTGMFWMVISEQGSFVVYLIGVLLLIISFLLTLLSGNSMFFGAWMLVVGALFLAVWAKKRSIRKAWMSIVLRGSIAYGAVRGFLITPRPAEGYPTNAEVVQMPHDGRGSECLPAIAN